MPCGGLSGLLNFLLRAEASPSPMPTPTPRTKFLNLLSRSLESRVFVRLRLSQPQDSANPVERVDFRLVELRGTVHLARVSHEARRDVTKNLTLQEAVKWIREHLGPAYRNGLLCTTERDWQLHVTERGKERLVGHKPSSSQPPPMRHDREKAFALGSEAQGWLRGLGILLENGRVRPSMADKHRQIVRYTEILSHLVRDCGWISEHPDRPLQAVDMGCGKGHLTFAAWHLFSHILHLNADVVGVEQRQALVTAANQLAASIGATNLRFAPGHIATTPLSRVDALIALHACNTATDEAIRRGIEQEAKLIVVAPCCHQAVRPELGDPEPFAALLRHGLFKERMAEWVTDGLRTLHLEWAGYKTKVIEFVGSEHTPKNLMLAGVRTSKPFADEIARDRVLQLKRFLGIKHHVLDPLLDRP